MPYKHRVAGSIPVAPTRTVPRRIEMAQWRSWLARKPVTLEVEGSSPFWVAIFASVAQSVEQGTENPCVASSILAGGTKGFWNFPVLGQFRFVCVAPSGFLLIYIKWTGMSICS